MPGLPRPPLELLEPPLACQQLVGKGALEAALGRGHLVYDGDCCIPASERAEDGTLFRKRRQSNPVMPPKGRGIDVVLADSWRGEGTKTSNALGSIHDPSEELWHSPERGHLQTHQVGRERAFAHPLGNNRTLPHLVETVCAIKEELAGLYKEFSSLGWREVNSFFRSSHDLAF